jgi:spermidine/putrescine transport system permease protein
MRKNSIINNVYVLFIFIFIFSPIIYLSFYSFNESGNMINFTGISFQAYEDLARDTNIQIVVLNTIIIGILSSIFATIIGVIGSLKLYLIKNKVEKNIFGTLNNVLLVSPDVLIGSLFLSLFLILQVKLGFFTVLIAHIAFSVPVVILLVYPKLEKMNQEILKASSDLGANDWQTIRKVIIPFLESSIIAAFFIALTYSLDDFAVTFFVTGSGFSTLSVEIYSMARQGIDLKINALSTIIFVVTTVIVMVNYFIQNKRGVNYEKNK